MQPIIRRTITITIIETWTITWGDGQERSWQETHDVVWPADQELAELFSSITNAAQGADNPFAPDGEDSTLNSAAEAK